MPTGVLAVVVGGVGGLLGGIVMAIMMMMMGDKPTTPPAIIAEKFMGDASKKPIVLFGYTIMWGLIFGVLVLLGVLQGTFVGALIAAAIAWILLGLMTLMAGAGMFGMNRDKMNVVMSLMMFVIWGVVVGVVFLLADSLFG